ncbi:hypothetical protein FPQ18DRAFT_405864 [Pyronema domesticum]|nr:hypothetical protein FPQ18DRAFT_405864 [Pyronema domesticum]
MTCGMKEYFREHRVVINTALCGGWASMGWGKGHECYDPQIAKTCEDFVANNPGKLKEA